MARKAQDVCPECGTSFPRGRLACPDCGSDMETGWKDAEEIDYSSVEIPESWDEDPKPARGLPKTFILAVVLALIGMLIYLVLM